MIEVGQEIAWADVPPGTIVRDTDRSIAWRTSACGEWIAVANLWCGYDPPGWPWSHHDIWCDLTRTWTSGRSGDTCTVLAVDVGDGASDDRLRDEVSRGLSRAYPRMEGGRPA